MAQYINPVSVHKAFTRLASKQDSGKTHLERSSAVLYFLAFDSVCHLSQKSVLDFDPEKLDGKNNRKCLELEFSRLVVLDNRVGYCLQYAEFGKVDSELPSPEKRISANFLTVPLKKATTKSVSASYPSRPDAPLLSLGPVATGYEWGICKHERFQDNFFFVLNSCRSSTPAIDLSLLLFRNVGFSDKYDNIFEALIDQWPKQFTESVSSLFIRRINSEKVLFEREALPFVSHYSNFAKLVISSKTEDFYVGVSRDSLISRINDLETKIRKYEEKFGVIDLE